MSYLFFAVECSYKANDGEVYTAKYMNIPGQENGNRLAWLDSANTYIYAISASDNQVGTNAKNYLAEALNIIKETQPAVYQVFGKISF